MSQFKIKRIDVSLPFPAYQTPGACGFDLYVRQDTRVEPFQPTLVPLNIIAKVPRGFVLLIASRSSLSLRKGLMLANGVGVIDQDFAGEKDEINALVLNFTRQTVVVKRGERIAQGILIRIAKSKLQEVKKVNVKSRGGFGSTGGHK